MNMPAWWAHRVRYEQPSDERAQPALVSVHMCEDCGAVVMPQLSRRRRIDGAACGVPHRELALLTDVAAVLNDCPVCSESGAARALEQHLADVFSQPRA